MKIARIDELIRFDKKHAGKSVLIGTDEVGRGPVAGPVMACAVHFRKFNKELKEALKYLDDSKKFGTNHRLRSELAEEIRKYSVFSVQQCSVEEIEELNILQASLFAMKKACVDVASQLAAGDKQADNVKILVDGKFIIPNAELPVSSLEQTGVIKGDSLSASIAAASILAKVERDELMINLANEFPQYDWHKNKGYPTPAHLEAIRKHGITEWHRQSFLTKCLHRERTV